MSRDIASSNHITQNNEMLFRLIVYHTYRVRKLEFVIMIWFLQGLSNEIKTRYTSAFIFLGLSLFSLGSFIGFYTSYIEESSSFAIISFYSIVPAVFILLWSVFGRWYFMMPSIGIVIFFTYLLLALLQSEYDRSIHHLIVTYAVISIAILFCVASFTMMIYKQHESKNLSIYIREKKRLVSMICICLIVSCPLIYETIQSVIVESLEKADVAFRSTLEVVAFSEKFDNVKVRILENEKSSPSIVYSSVNNRLVVHYFLNGLYIPTGMVFICANIEGEGSGYIDNIISNIEQCE